MNLAELKEKASKDLHIDKEALDTKSVEIPYLVGEWLKILNEEVLILRRLDADHKKLRGQKFHFYKNEYQVIIKSSGDVMEYINADDEIKQSQLKLDFQMEKTKYVESVIDALNKMSFNIGNAIKWAMFKSGG